MVDAKPEINPDEMTIRTTMAHLLASNDWHLLDADQLTYRVLAVLKAKSEADVAMVPRGDTSQSEPARPWRRSRMRTFRDQPGYGPIKSAALHVYSETLYNAYTNNLDTTQQERAYHELFRYVARVATYYAADLARDEREEITYQTLTQLYVRLMDQTAGGNNAKIRIPSAFLAVALQQTRNAVRQWRTLSKHFEPPTFESVGEVGSTILDTLPNTNAAYDLDGSIERQELRMQVIRLYTAALQQYPRARMQLHVVWLHQMESLNYTTIADQLGMTVENVRLLYFRGIRRLSEMPGFRALAEEEQLTPAHKPIRRLERQPDMQRGPGT